jgi:hypothetical protein
LNKLSENNYEELVDKVEELVEFIEDTIPGPGYYDVKREFENVKPKGINIKHNHRDFKKYHYYHHYYYYSYYYYYYYYHF